MSEEEKTRADEVQEYKEDIKETINEVAKVKELAQSNIEENRDICVNMDRVEDSLGKQKEVAETLTKDVMDGIPKTDWDHLRIQFDQIANIHRTIFSLRRDMESTKTQISGFKTVANTFTSSNATSAVSGYKILMTHADKYPSVKSALEKVVFSPTWIGDIDFIRQELPKIMLTAVNEFESVVADMSGTGDQNLKYKALLSLRSIIFHQLFDTLAEEASYSLTSWFRITPPRVPFRKMRFCQAKFFIIGNRDESIFPQSMTDAVNKTAMELQNHFDEMSNYGKQGATSTLVDNCYKETLASFANALRLKSEVEKSYP